MNFLLKTSKQTEEVPYVVYASVSTKNCITKTTKRIITQEMVQKRKD